MALALYKFMLPCGRMGRLAGLFVAKVAAVERAIGKEVSFGDTLGKHSDVSCTLSEAHLTVKCDDQDFIAKLVGLLGTNVSGYNPLDYLVDDTESEGTDAEAEGPEENDAEAEGPTGPIEATGSETKDSEETETEGTETEAESDGTETEVEGPDGRPELTHKRARTS